jgi:Ca-activated chloride channel family protein
MMRHRVIFCFLALPLMLLWAVPPSQTIEVSPGAPRTQNPQSPTQAGTIRISTSLVLIPVSVTDSSGQAVKNLQLEDFSIIENGHPVTIEHLGEPGLTRLEMVLAFDVTGSTRPRFGFEKQAAASFLKTIFRPRDGMMMIAIASEPRLFMSRTESLISALDELDRLQPEGTTTAFFDSIIAASQLFTGPTDAETRRVVIALSDGEDNLNPKKLPEALRAVQLADCIFYSINPGGPSIRLNPAALRGQQAMEALAEQTGGTAFLAEKLEELGTIYARIAAELQAQYQLSYYSPDSKTDDGFRSTTVTVPKRPELRIRARQGYYAGRPRSR